MRGRVAAEGGIVEGPRPANARELQAIIHAERGAVPFFVYRDADGQQRIIEFGPPRTELTVGRNPAADLSIVWDDEVSGLHAELEQRAGELTLVDDGLSRNGSYINGERVHGRRRLRDRDVLRFGQTLVLVRKPADAERTATSVGPRPLTTADLSEQQRRVLVALCRPFKDGDPYATPATNRQIADELYLSIAAVKPHLRALFDKLGVADLPQNKKRLALVGRALQTGLLTDRELAADPGDPR
jgi:pSer/pThr/pTyr-binding forkhead associated (FHA) protein